ncbi:MAG: RDD family protein [Rhodanobacter sp.]|jgi:uncharacterized RDD family membrane protein YckC|nr:RDD family protein [Rhodanobacter sp.]
MSSSRPAALWLRFAAAVYDLLPLLGLWMLVAGVFLLAAHGSVDVVHPPPGYRFALRLALFAVTAAYFVISWSRGGQTIGMRAWRIEVVAADGAMLPWPRALLRFVVALVSLLAAGLGFFWSFIDRERRCWHDIASGSSLRKRPPR